MLLSNVDSYACCLRVGIISGLCKNWIQTEACVIGSGLYLTCISSVAVAQESGGALVAEVCVQIRQNSVVSGVGSLETLTVVLTRLCFTLIHIKLTVLSFITWSKELCVNSRRTDFIHQYCFSIAKSIVSLY